MNPSGVKTNPEPLPPRSDPLVISTLTTALLTRSLAPITAREYASSSSRSEAGCGGFEAGCTEGVSDETSRTSLITIPEHVVSGTASEGQKVPVRRRAGVASRPLHRGTPRRRSLHQRRRLFPHRRWAAA